MRAELSVLIDNEVLDSEYRLSGVPFPVLCATPRAGEAAEKSTRPLVKQRRGFK